HVRLSLSGSFLPSATATTLIFATPGLIGVIPLLGFTGTANPGAVHCPGVSVSMALARVAPAATLRGVTRTLVIAVEPQAPPTSKQAWSGNVHTPSALPSWSQAVPSTQVVPTAAAMPPHSMTQSVAAGPPPGTQSGGHTAPARRTNSRELRIRYRGRIGGNNTGGPNWCQRSIGRRGLRDDCTVTRRGRSVRAGARGPGRATRGEEETWCALAARVVASGAVLGAPGRRRQSSLLTFAAWSPLGP